MAHKGIPKLVAPVLFTTILYTVQLCTCTKSLLCKLAYYSHSSGKVFLLFQHNSHRNRELKIMLAQSTRAQQSPSSFCSMWLHRVWLLTTPHTGRELWMITVFRVFIALCFEVRSKWTQPHLSRAISSEYIYNRHFTVSRCAHKLTLWTYQCMNT